MRNLCVWIAFGVFASAGYSKPQEVLLFANGGYNSCDDHQKFDIKNPYGMNMADKALGVAQALTDKNIKVRWILACLGWSVPTKKSSKVRVVTSDDPDKLFKASVSDIPSILQAYLNDKQAPIFLVGHSYGAWISMKSALALKGIAQVKGVYSIDAISPIYCTPYKVPILGSGCHEAPRDLQDKKVELATNDWLNFYQQDYFWITSNSMNKAENAQLKYDRKGHYRIAHSVKVWRGIARSIAFEISQL